MSSPSSAGSAASHPAEALARLSVQGLTKRYGGRVVLDAVDFTVAPGEIHALLGENGAGKSTLVNCVFGMVQPDAGFISVDGEPVVISGPRHAKNLGIGMVHQHFKLVEGLTVAENVFLGQEEHGPFGVVLSHRQRRRVQELSDELAFGIDPDAIVGELSVGAQQRVEILKALVREVELLILDEPTAVLTPSESLALFDSLRTIVARGLSIILISHHIAEVKAFADKVTVLRRGRVVASGAVDDFSRHEIAERIVGEELPVEDPSWQRAQIGAIVLQLDSVRLLSNRGVEMAPLELTVRAGEIVCLVGIPGNGQSEVVEAITGLRRLISGSIQIAGEVVSDQGPHRPRRAGLAHIPEDRNLRGISVLSSVADNIAAGHLDGDRLGRPFLRPRSATRFASELAVRFDVQPPDPSTRAGRLSGGNAQKVVVARELSQKPRLAVAAEPVRGLDIRAARFVHQQLVDLRLAGSAVLVASTEVSDMLSIADRLVVMSGGAIVAEYSTPFPTAMEVSKVMLGVNDE